MTSETSMTEHSACVTSSQAVVAIFKNKIITHPTVNALGFPVNACIEAVLLQQIKNRFTYEAAPFYFSKKEHSGYLSSIIVVIISSVLQTCLTILLLS